MSDTFCECGNPSRIFLTSMPARCGDCSRLFRQWDDKKDQPASWTAQDRILLAKMAAVIAAPMLNTVIQSRVKTEVDPDVPELAVKTARAILAKIDDEQ